MSDKILKGILSLILGFVLGISFINFAIDKGTMAELRTMSELNESIEFKKELILEYESYYYSAESLINNRSIDSTAYYNSKHRLDSLYRTQL